MSNVITFEIKEHIGIINNYPNGWTKEINLVSWCNSVPKYDIREWDETHTRMSRGITLTAPEMQTLLASMEGRL